MSQFEKYQFNTQFTNDNIPLQTADSSLKDFAMAAGGNIGGGIFNTVMNGVLQERQFEEQEKLQRNAYKMNERAVANQAQLQKLGMQNAGLNPAGVNGTSAPSVQAGAAAGSTSTMGNIFNGLAELITAAKAPSEIEKTITESSKLKAETEKTGVETNELLPTQIDNLKQSTAKLVEETQNMKNINDIFEAKDRYIRDSMQDEYTTLMETMQKNNTWKDLGEKTRSTIEKIANGDTSIGIGELEGMLDVVLSQLKISDADRTLKANQLMNRITNLQLKDKNVQNALARMPKEEYDKIIEEQRTLAKQRDLMAGQIGEHNASTKLKKFQEEEGKANDEMWQRIYNTGKDENGKELPGEENGKEIRNKKFRDEAFQEGLNTVGGVIRGVATGGAIGAGNALGSRIGKALEKKKAPTYDNDKGNIFKGGLEGWQNDPKNNTFKGGGKIPGNNSAPWKQSTKKDNFIIKSKNWK